MKRRDFFAGLAAIPVAIAAPTLFLQDIDGEDVRFLLAGPWYEVGKNKVDYAEIWATVTYRDGTRKDFSKAAVVSGNQEINIRQPNRDEELCWQIYKRTHELCRDIVCAMRERVGLSNDNRLWEPASDRLFNEAWRQIAS